MTPNKEPCKELVRDSWSCPPPTRMTTGITWRSSDEAGSKQIWRESAGKVFSPNELPGNADAAGNWVQSLGQVDPLEKKMATHSSILAWRIPWTEESGKLQSTGSLRDGYN